MDFVALQGALYARLKGSVELAALVTGIFDYVPDTQLYPYVVFHTLSGSRESTLDLTTRMVLEQQIRAYSNDADTAKGNYQVRAIASVIYSLFDAACFFMGNQRLQAFVTRINIMPDVATLRTGIITVQILFAT